MANLSIERTLPDKPVNASHVQRYSTSLQEHIGDVPSRKSNGRLGRKVAVRVRFIVATSWMQLLISKPIGEHALIVT